MTRSEALRRMDEIRGTPEFSRPSLNPSKAAALGRELNDLAPIAYAPEDPEPEERRRRRTAAERASIDLANLRSDPAFLDGSDPAKHAELQRKVAELTAVVVAGEEE